MAHAEENLSPHGREPLHSKFLPGAPGLGRSVYLRGLLAGADHAIFTATIGAGIGWARTAQAESVRRLAPVVAAAAACLQHIAWNGVASEAIVGALCGAEVPGGACRAMPSDHDLVVVVPLLTLAFSLRAVACSSISRLRGKE